MTPNRQINRTRTAITDAFTELALSTNYETIKISDIAKLANVGRSTLYSHYRDKDDILRASMSWVLDGLASCTAPDAAQTKIIPVLDHIWQYREKARRILFGTTGEKLERALSTKIAETFAHETDKNAWVIPPVLVAHQTAASIFSLLQNWVTAQASCPIPALAHHLCTSTQAVKCAAMKTSGPNQAS